MRLIAAAAVIVVLAGCGDEPAPGHVVVYAHEGTRAQRIEEMLAEFTAETGVLTTLKTGDSAQMADAIIAKTDAPRADVLITAGAADIWRAAESGALRPLDEGVLQRVPELLQDPDGYWIAAAAHAPAVVTANGAATPALDSIEDLGDAAYSGRLCLSSSALPGNRALIAALIETSDNKTAERMIRRWVRNLALPPFESEAKLVDAVRSGACELGIVTANTPLGTLSQFWPENAPASFHIDGIGVARHATDAAAAQRLVAWVADRVDLRMIAVAEYVHAGVGGRRDEEARLLAERAGYR